jgi:hypothetical protein
MPLAKGQEGGESDKSEWNDEVSEMKDHVDR